MVKKKETLRVDQANVFYNYTIGFDLNRVDLVKTALKLLKTGIAKAVFFSDFKCLYNDEQKKVQIEWIRPQGRQWDPSWEIRFGSKVPEAVATELIHAFAVSFQENGIENSEARQLPPYLRAALPPIVLEENDVSVPIFVSVKLFADGIAVLSFQYDATWDGVDVNFFISDIVNLYRHYCKSIWVDSRVQRLDAEELLPNAFESVMSIAGNPLNGWKARRLLRKMRRRSRQVLNESLDAEGRCFDVGNEKWILHELAGSQGKDSWESTMELCRSQYTNVLCKILVPYRNQRKLNVHSNFMWQGRPSISLMRFRNQPASKGELLSRFSSSLSRILMRSAEIDAPSELPPDLRPFGDYCFHGNRSLLLWTWLRLGDAPANAWDDSKTSSMVMENQARTEHIEYYNMRTARACTWAQSPPTEGHLLDAYEILAFTDTMIHHSSQSGEISDALAYLMTEFGTLELVSSGKETARWYLDELRYRSDKSRSRVDRCLVVVFGLVGATGLADFLIRPSLIATWPNLSHEITPILAFGVSGAIVILIIVLIWLFQGTHR